MAPDLRWSDIAGQARPREATVSLCVDGTVQSRLEAARRRLADERRRSADTLDGGDVGPALEEVERLEDQAATSTFEFAVRSCGHERWRELLVTHRSDDPAERWDASTFVPAAIAECCDAFDSPAEVSDAAKTLTTAQILKLFNAVRRVNEDDDLVPTTRGR